ncbi:MAG: TIGR03560 family F420-dependent LLM class oxidoreductase [Nitrosopumilales archaeon]|nr:TIGR03560 family F420-dependent LLM class oxidoreductase [Nitrosopumilales archaeon]
MQKQHELEFGLTIPQGWRGGDLPLEEENDPAKQYEFSKSISVAADRIGFGSICAYDHFIPFYSDDRDKNIFECFTLLSALAAITERIKIGQIVTCNSYRNPSLVAKMVSTLDIMSNGRVELGIGAGWYEQEYIAYGYHFPSNVSRIKQLDESLSIIKAMWKEERASFEGKYYRIKEAICNPKPIQKPHPIIMIGGSGEKYLLKVVAKHADRYNLFFGTPNEMKTKISVLKEHCKSIGRDYKELQYSIVLPCIIKGTDQEVNQVLVQYKRKDKTLEEYLQYLVGGVAVGTPEKVLQGIKKYIDIGVTHFILHFIGLDETTLRLFDAKVIRSA